MEEEEHIQQSGLPDLTGNLSEIGKLSYIEERLIRL